MVKIGDCPHCHSRVAVGRTGICPNCQRDTNDLTRVDANMSALHVKHNAELPDLCCLCGVATKRTVRVEDHTSEQLKAAPGGGQVDGDALAFSGLGALFSLVGWGIAVLARTAFQSARTKSAGGFNYRSVKTSVPQCEMCADKQIAPLDSDFDLQTIKILVCRTFRSAYENANQD